MFTSEVIATLRDDLLLDYIQVWAIEIRDCTETLNSYEERSKWKAHKTALDEAREMMAALRAEVLHRMAGREAGERE